MTTAADTDVMGSRIFAALIDIVVLAGLFVAFAFAFGGVNTGHPGQTGTHVQLSLHGGPAFLFFAAVLAYYFVFETLFGASIGKLMLGLRVLSDDGSRAGAGAVLIRTLFRIIDGLPVLYLVGLIAASIGGRHKRLGDRAGGTIVARRRPAAAPSAPGLAGA